VAADAAGLFWSLSLSANLESLFGHRQLGGLGRLRRIVLPVLWLLGLALTAISSGHALNYIGHPGSYFFFDSLLPILIIVGLLIITIRELKSS
jgi:hypothetical protein